jgi:hypothetical protein
MAKVGWEGNEFIEFHNLSEGERWKRELELRYYYIK